MKVPLHDHDAHLVTLATINSAEVAEIIRISLAAANIPAQIDGEHQAGFTGALQIGILVRESDLAKATKVLKETSS